MVRKRLESKTMLVKGFVFGIIILLLLSFLQLAFLGFAPFQLKALLIPTISGGLSGVIVAYLILRNRLQNQELKESEVKFQTLINLSLDGIYVENERGEILDCNTMGHEMFGYSKDEMLKLSIRDIVPSEFASLLPDIITNEMATGDVYLERENMKKDGTIFPTEINTKFVYLNGEKRLIAYVRDITERKETEAALKEVIATKDKLFSIIGHDLRGYFGNIMGFSDLLLSGSDVNAASLNKKFLELIQNSATNANQLLQNLLDWASVQTNKIKSETDILYLNPLVNRVLEQVEDQAAIKSVKLINQTDTEVQLWADEKLIKTVFRNLLANAIKYSFNEGQIVISSKSAENNTVRISIKDEGVGMSAKTLGKLFDVSHSETLPGTNKERGTGLGLLICKDFVEKLNGKIYVESTMGKGSTFHVELPTSPIN